MNELDYVPEAEFSAWLTPRQTLDALCEPWHRKPWVVELNERIRGSQLRIAAESIVTYQGSTEEHDALAVIPAKWWQQAVAPNDTNDFWTTGRLTLPPTNGMRATVNDRAMLFGIRFDPAGVEKMRPGIVPVGPIQSAQPERTVPIGTGEMRKFAQLYLEIWGSKAKEIPAWEAMKACYPDGIIGRDTFLAEFRELRGPGKRGNPSFRGQ